MPIRPKNIQALAAFGISLTMLLAVAGCSFFYDTDLPALPSDPGACTPNVDCEDVAEGTTDTGLGDTAEPDAGGGGGDGDATPTDTNEGNNEGNNVSMPSDADVPDTTQDIEPADVTPVEDTVTPGDIVEDVLAEDVAGDIIEDVPDDIDTPCPNGDPNACGGCAALPASPGASCLDCGMYACDGVDSLKCVSVETTCDDGDGRTQNDLCLEGVCRGVDPNGGNNCNGGCGDGVCNSGCNGGGCPDCGDGCGCGYACSGNRCGGALTCDSGASCHRRAESASEARINCQDAACAQFCNSVTGECSITCEGSAVCQLDCNSTATCRINCNTPDARCRMRCNSVDDCDLDCPDGVPEVSCGDGWRGCGQASCD